MKAKLKICDEHGELSLIWKNHEGKRYCQKCWNKIKPVKKAIENHPKPIAKRSDKRMKQEVAYGILRKAFLINHPHCQAKVTTECKLKSSEVHHKAGRIGELLCGDSKFLAVCTPCHQHIENNREQAIELGFSELRTNK